MIRKASQRAKDIPYDEIDRIEFETREVVSGILDLQEAKSWEILSQGMIIQEVALEGVQMAEEMDEENFIKTLQVTTPSGVVTKVWSTPRKLKTTAGRLEKLATLVKDTRMPTQLVLGEESPTLQQKKKGCFSGPMDPFSEGINVAGPSNTTSALGQIEPPPIPTPALPLSSYT